MSKSGYHGVDGFVEGLGCTVRECVDCAALVAGGPTRCIRCATEGAPTGPTPFRVLIATGSIRLAVKRLRRLKRKAKGST